MNAIKNGTSRRHIVLVPGFGGFDALGSIRYYSGTTATFDTWRKDRGPGAGEVALRYADTLPTAPVAARAVRLCRYLASRIARNEIQEDDTIALVGHSTGGLDIRRLLVDLNDSADGETFVDGDDPESASSVKNRDMLDKIRRLVFISVPQRGTNIADFVRGHRTIRSWVTDGMSMPFDGLMWDKIRKRLAALLDTIDLDLLHAAADALQESDERLFTRYPANAAMAREAFASLWLWTHHIAADVGALEDLAVKSSSGGTPPRYEFSSPERRAKERALWAKGDNPIETLSIATLGKEPLPLRDSIEDALKLLFDVDAGSWPWHDKGEADGAYQLCHAMCARGPFEIEGDSKATRFDNGALHPIAAHQNDGIVNTASMLWPNRQETLLVDADHGDIIGHFIRKDANGNDGRKYAAYDIFKSGSGFNEKTFGNVWRRVFDFCMT